MKSTVHNCLPTSTITPADLLRQYEALSKLQLIQLLLAKDLLLSQKEEQLCKHSAGSIFEDMNGAFSFAFESMIIEENSKRSSSLK